MLGAPKTALRRYADRLRSAAGRIRGDDRGAVALMVAGSVFSITLVIGGSIDVYRYEMLRKRAQNTLDRAVLASAALEQKIADSETVVRSYMTSAGLELPSNAQIVACPKAGPAVCCPLEDASNQLECLTDWRNYSGSFRSVAVTATYEMEMAFLWLAGQEKWDVPVRSSAMERERLIEISLVLDISGSMKSSVGNSTQRRIDALRPAAVNFVNSVLGDSTAEENTSISIVPYAGQVSMGRAMYDHLGIPRLHETASCVNFEDEDFGSGVPDFAARAQTKMFTNWHYHTGAFKHSTTTKDWSVKGKKWFTEPDGDGPTIVGAWWCPDDPHVYVTGQYELEAWGNSKISYDGDGKLTNLKDDEDYTFDWTDKKYTGTQWEDAEFVLPAGQSIFVQEGDVDDDLYDHIAMCDEVDADSDRVCDVVPGPSKRNFQSADSQGDIRFDSDRTSITYLSNNKLELADAINGYHLYDGTGTDIAMLWAMILLDPGFSGTFNGALGAGVIPTHPTGPARPTTFTQRPAAFTDANTSKYIVLMTDGRITKQFKPQDSNALVSYHNASLNTRVSSGDAKSQFDDMCELARNSGVEVFTIGFDLGGSGNADVRTRLSDCASSASHYFNVEDGNLDGAFQAIAASIQKVRLTS